MRVAGDSPEGVRLRGIVVVLWRAGLRISEALALNETDLDPDRGSLLVRHGKGDKRREVGMDRWAWTHLEPWLEIRKELPVGRLFCVLRGPTAGRPLRVCGNPCPVASRLGDGGCATPIRAAPTPPRARRRDVPRRDLADRDPTPARACRPGDHVTVPARDRQHRDHRCRPPTAGTNDPRRSTHRAASLNPHTGAWPAREHGHTPHPPIPTGLEPCRL